MMLFASVVLLPVGMPLWSFCIFVPRHHGHQKTSKGNGRFCPAKKRKRHEAILAALALLLGIILQTGNRSQACDVMRLQTVQRRH